MQQLYEEEFVNALYDLYQKYWYDTSTVDINYSGYAGISERDLCDLEEICLKIERLDS